MSGQLNIRVDDELKRAFIDKAKVDNTTATDLLVGFMRQYLGLETHPNSAIDSAEIEATIIKRLDIRLADSEAINQQRVDTRISEIEARIKALEGQQLGELAA
jgi:hypothetical protein